MQHENAVETAAPVEIAKEAYGRLHLMIPTRCLEKSSPKTGYGFSTVTHSVGERIIHRN